MCGQLWCAFVPDEGALADLLADAEDVADAWEARADEEPLDALAVLRPNARVAPSAAAPTAVPIRGLGILILLSLPSRRWRRFSLPSGRVPVTRWPPVGQARLARRCALPLSPR